MGLAAGAPPPKAHPALHPEDTQGKAEAGAGQEPEGRKRTHPVFNHTAWPGTSLCAPWGAQGPRPALQGLRVGSRDSGRLLLRGPHPGLQHGRLSSAWSGSL